MAVKITDLTEDTTPADGDWVLTVDVSANASKKVTRKNFFKNANITIPIIMDTSNNEILKFASVASAVNEFTFTNAATGNAPSMAATGGDTNIHADITPKGTGRVRKNAKNIDAWEEIGRTTLGVAGDSISVTSLPAKKYLKIEASLLQSGSIDTEVRFNNDSGNNYSYRYSANGAADTAANTQSFILLATSAATDKQVIANIVNITAKEKMVTAQTTDIGAAGVATSPAKFENAGKWVNTAAQISRIDFINGGAGDFAAASEVVVYGHD